MKIRVTGLICMFALLASGAEPKATPEEARKFIDDAEQKLLLLSVDSAKADWIKSTYITDDSEALAAKLDERTIAAAVQYAKQSTRFDGLKQDPVTARLLRFLIAVGLTAGSVLSKARTSMVDGFPYKEEVGGSSPSVPTKPQRKRSSLRSRSSVG